MTAHQIPEFQAGPTRLAGHKDKTVVVGGQEVNMADIIIGMVSPKAKVLADIFGGTNIVGARGLRAGLDLVTNDWRKQSYYCAMAMLANRAEPTDEVAARLMSGAREPGPVTRMYGGPLGQDNALEIDRVIRNARTLRAEGEENLAVAAFYAITHVILVALKVYHLHLSEDRRVFLGNEHVRALDLIGAWRKWFLCDYPRGLFVNGPRVECHCADAVELIGRIRPCCAIIDSLYPCGGYDHISDFKVLEDLCDIFEGVEEGKIGMVRAQPKHRFGSRQSFLGSMTHLLLRATHVPQWIICINTSSDVSPEEIELIVKATGRNCVIHRYPVDLPSAIPGARSSTNCECLLDCRLDAAAADDVARIKAELSKMANLVD